VRSKKDEQLVRPIVRNLETSYESRRLGSTPQGRGGEMKQERPQGKDGFVRQEGRFASNKKAS